jgi:hypothetical protein
MPFKKIWKGIKKVPKEAKRQAKDLYDAAYPRENTKPSLTDPLHPWGGKTMYRPLCCVCKLSVETGKPHKCADNMSSICERYAGDCDTCGPLKNKVCDNFDFEYL